MLKRDGLYRKCDNRFECVFLIIVHFWESLRPLLDPYLTLTIARVWRGGQILIIVLFFLRCFVEENGAIVNLQSKGCFICIYEKKVVTLRANL